MYDFIFWACVSAGLMYLIVDILIHERKLREAQRRDALMRICAELMVNAHKRGSQEALDFVRNEFIKGAR